MQNNDLNEAKQRHMDALKQGATLMRVSWPVVHDGHITNYCCGKLYWTKLNFGYGVWECHYCGKTEAIVDTHYMKQEAQCKI